MKINFIDLQAQYEAYKNEIDKEVSEVFSTAQFIGGGKLAAFEKALADYTGAVHAIGCSSGTDALLLSLMALDIGKDDEVITTPFTFIATVEAIALVGATPVFVDIEADTYTIDAAQIEAKITSKTKAIIPVSLYGQCSDMDTINSVAAKHNITVIEDAAQSFGATYKGKKSCALSTIATTSFFPAKPLGCAGDGGAVFTSDEALAAKIRSLLNHGQSVRYSHELIGINGRLDSLQAAVLNVKLKHFDDEIFKRQCIVKAYNNALRECPAITIPTIKEDRTSVYAQYTIQCNDREAIKAKLDTAGIPSAIHYPIPVHLQPAFGYLGFGEGNFPVSEACAKSVLSLPMSAFLKQDEQEYIIAALKA